MTDEKKIPPQLTKATRDMVIATIANDCIPPVKKEVAQAKPVEKKPVEKPDERGLIDRLSDYLKAQITEHIRESLKQVTLADEPKPQPKPKSKPTLQQCATHTVDWVTEKQQETQGHTYQRDALVNELIPLAKIHAEKRDTKAEAEAKAKTAKSSPSR